MALCDHCWNSIPLDLPHLTAFKFSFFCIKDKVLAVKLNKERLIKESEEYHIYEMVLQHKSKLHVCRESKCV